MNSKNNLKVEEFIKLAKSNKKYKEGQTIPVNDAYYDVFVRTFGEILVNKYYKPSGKRG